MIFISKMSAIFFITDSGVFYEFFEKFEYFQKNFIEIGVQY